MPGFDLAQLCARMFAAEAGSKTIGMVLMNHGMFSFGDTAEESYKRMIALVARAEDYLAKNRDVIARMARAIARGDNARRPYDGRQFTQRNPVELGPNDWWNCATERESRFPHRVGALNFEAAFCQLIEERLIAFGMTEAPRLHPHP